MGAERYLWGYIVGFACTWRSLLASRNTALLGNGCKALEGSVAFLLYFIQHILSLIVGKDEPGLTYRCWLSIKSLMWGSLNLQGLILISSKKLLLAESDKAFFSLILPSPALAELWEHTYLWEFIWWSPQLAFIVLNNLPNRWLMHGASEKWSDSIFCNFSLLGESVPRFLLGICPSACPLWNCPFNAQSLQGAVIPFFFLLVHLCPGFLSLLDAGLTLLPEIHQKFCTNF